MVKKVEDRNSGKKMSKKKEDVICLNCFSAEDLKEPEPTITLRKVRQEHREKLKLYSFLASEISKPRVVPLKQKVSEPYAVGKKIDETITKDIKYAPHAPKKNDNEKINAVPKGDKFDLDAVALFQVSDILHEADEKFVQNDETEQNRDHNSDQISLAESVNENTFIDSKYSPLSSSLIIIDDKLLPSSYTNSAEQNSKMLESKKTLKDSATRWNQLSSKQSIVSSNAVSVPEKDKKNIPKDAYLPKSLSEELNEAELSDPTNNKSNISIDNKYDSKLSEKVKKSSKLFKLFTKTKSDKKKEITPSTKQPKINSENHYYTYFEPVDEPFNEVSVDEKFSDKYRAGENNSLVIANETDLSSSTPYRQELDFSQQRLPKDPENQLSSNKKIGFFQAATNKKTEKIINETTKPPQKRKILKLENEILHNDIKSNQVFSTSSERESNVNCFITYSKSPPETQTVKPVRLNDILVNNDIKTDLNKQITKSNNSVSQGIWKSASLPLDDCDAKLYYDLDSGSIREEPEYYNYDAELTRTPSFHKCLSQEIKEIVKIKPNNNDMDDIYTENSMTPISLTPNVNKMYVEDIVSNSENIEKRAKRKIDIFASKDLAYEEITATKELAKHDLPDVQKNVKNVTMLYKTQIETPTVLGTRDVTNNEHKVIPCSVILSPAKNNAVLEDAHYVEYHSLGRREESDKADAASSNGSDSGYTGSSNRLENVKTPSTPESLSGSPESIESKIKNLRRSMPVLSITSGLDKNLSAYSFNSLGRNSNLDSKSNEKKIRWSTLSICKKPYDNDDEVFSESLSPGHATLPRRSNSPLPHERDLDRERFPINRSGLQKYHFDKSEEMNKFGSKPEFSSKLKIPDSLKKARSESMASVYSGAGEGTRASVTVKGDVQFSLLYNYRLGALEVGVKRCRDLAAVDVKRNRSDPYVKVYLLPDKSKAGKRKTKVKKNTLNPVFEESLSFVQPLGSLSARTLWLSVWHADMFGRNDFLGEVTLPLTDVVFDDPAPQWHKLHERTEQFDEQHGSRGDLIVGLKFELQEGSRAKGTLHVLVKEAKNLLATKPNGLADVFCKSYLLPERGRLAKQKTSVARRTLNPRWEHTFTYRGLTLQELGSRALELSLWDRDRLASNDFMGAIRLSLGTGTYMGASVNWMDSAGKEVSLWQTMMQQPNLWVEGSLPLRPQLLN